MKQPAWHRGVPSLRIQTYKTSLQAKRSYYKYVCKEGLFTNLVNGERPWLSNPYSIGNIYLSGYPLYNAPKSAIRDQWERIGNQGLERKRDELFKQEMERLEVLRNEEERKNRIVRALLKGTGVSIWDAYQQLGIDQAGRDLLESQAFILAIKALLKTKPHEQHHRTPKRTLRPSSIPTPGPCNRKGRNRNYQCSRKGSALC